MTESPTLDGYVAGDVRENAGVGVSGLQQPVASARSHRPDHRVHQSEEHVVVEQSDAVTRKNKKYNTLQRNFPVNTSHPLSDALVSPEKNATVTMGICKCSNTTALQTFDLSSFS